MKSIHHLIKTLYRLDYNNLKAIDDLIVNIEAHLTTHGQDSKLELALHALNARKADELNRGFDKVCAAAKFVVDKLKDQEDWDVVEFDIFCAVVGRIKDYELTIAMMEKCFDMLERNFKDLRHYDYRKARIFGEMTNRFMRAKFLDNVDPQELKERFDTCAKSAIKMWEKLGYVAMRTSVLVRQAIFNENPDKILECVKAMEITRDKYWIKSSKDEAVEYVRFLGDNVTTRLHNFMMGWQIQKRRKELGMGTQEFADMIGSTQTAVNEIERGDAGVGTERFYKIAKVLQIHNLSYFYGEPLVNATAITDNIFIYQVGQFMSDISKPDQEFIRDLVKQTVDHIKKK